MTDTKHTMPGERTAPPAVQLQDVALRYRKGAAPAVSGVSLSVPEGGSLGIVGESGSGKSTVARLIVHERDATSGEVRIFGRPWKEIPPHGEVRRSVQMIFQDPYGALNPRLTPLAAVTETVSVARGLRRKEARDVAADLLQDVGIGLALAERSPGRLSGGQRQRVVIARALACEPRVLVADEPTSALDVSVQAQILNLLLRLREERGLTLILISHDISVVHHMTEDVTVMRHGRIVEQGTTAQVFDAPAHDYTRELVAAFHAE
ncbi:ABC-type glutathione transport system ATPase component [Streptosporangium becharense]|uniref:ABC-type glutathione transport system ATPase component n=1 Tax=Streptosporangium becharense TaxID=1816182 RepID=A0A7W9IAD9_9ACTN|nr:ATP-binding cassette domain-containing protein [Streptosporangium becharense]MBB2914053.1 ABC-type glutathione transport system ATPase component [Streptosporangium becharense]MBB5817080.1 ABC-type glutathione transport system ATPase component [Streptosporangium becharense]